MKDFKRVDAFNLFEYIQAHTTEDSRPEYTPATITGLHMALNDMDFTGFAGYYAPEAIQAMQDYFTQDSSRYFAHLAALNAQCAIYQALPGEPATGLPFPV